MGSYLTFIHFRFLGKSKTGHRYPKQQQASCHQNPRETQNITKNQGRNQQNLQVITHSTTFVLTFQREFDLLKNINHEGIVKYYDLIETDYSHEQSNTASKSHHSASPTKSPTSTSSSLASYSSAGMQDGKIYLIMEWLGDGCNLTSWIQQHQHDNNAESRHIREILKGLLEAIEYLHMAGITHHDIKLDNIIYDPVKRSVKLIDFGVSEQSTNDEAYSAFGTPAYQPPELFTREADGKAFVSGHKLDIWAIGVVAFQLANQQGALPFDGSSLMEIFDKIIHIEPNWDCCFQDQKELVDLISSNNFGFINVFFYKYF
jgi:serine/threonine protein kinase